VFISDVWALDSSLSNVKVAQRFDSKRIGGCMIPICQDINISIRKFMQKTVNEAFNTILGDCFTNYFNEGNNGDNGYVYVDLEIPNKHAFFRKLSHIVNFNPPKQSVEFTDLRRYNSPDITL